MGCEHLFMLIINIKASKHKIFTKSLYKYLHFLKNSFLRVEAGWSITLNRIIEIVQLKMNILS